MRKRGSGRWQAGYVGPDGQVHNAPSTFDAKDYAVVWLNNKRKLAESPDWMPPTERRAAALAGLPPTLAEYADGWLASRTLKPRTAAGYRRLLDKHILPGLGVSGVPPEVLGPPTAPVVGQPA